ncbi:MAG: MotA/TolQ/ExbB proton channel family protein [Planctomycetota bacterium]
MNGWMSRAAEVFEGAGWVGWPLLLMSVVAVALCIERAVYFTLLRRRIRTEVVAPVVRRLSRGGVESERVVADGLIGDFVEAARSAAGPGPIGDAAVLAAGEAARSRLERWLPTLSTIITAAPMLGILGTVTGIIQSFGLLGSAEVTRDTTAMAAGISEALYTTAFGLVIALVVLFPYNALRSAADSALATLETVGAAAIEGSSRGGVARDAGAQPESASASTSSA